MEDKKNRKVLPISIIIKVKKTWINRNRVYDIALFDGINKGFKKPYFGRNIEVKSATPGIAYEQMVNDFAVRTKDDKIEVECMRFFLLEGDWPLYSFGDRFGLSLKLTDFDIYGNLVLIPKVFLNSPNQPQKSVVDGEWSFVIHNTLKLEVFNMKPGSKIMIQFFAKI